jgi:hypothetical protein
VRARHIDDARRRHAAQTGSPTEVQEADARIVFGRRLWAAAGLHTVLLAAVTVALLLWGTDGDGSSADAVTLYTDGSWQQVGSGWSG